MTDDSPNTSRDSGLAKLSHTRAPSTTVTVLRKIIAISAAGFTALVMVLGNDWRGWPPAVWEFVVLIVISAIGFGFGIGACRDAKSIPLSGTFASASAAGF